MIPKYCVNCTDNTKCDKAIAESAYRENTFYVQSNRQVNQSSTGSFEVAPGSPIILGIQYTQGYLRSIIGKKVLVEFLLGTEGSTDRSGILTDVGVSYIILQETETGNRVLCDIYSIKFVTIFK